MLSTLHRLIKPPTFSDLEVNNRAWMLHYMSLSFGMLSIAFQVVIFWIKPSEMRLTDLTLTSLTLLGVLVVQILTRQGKVEAAATVFIGVAWTLGTLRIFANGNMHSAGFSIYIVIILAAGMLGSMRLVVLTTILSILMGIVSAVMVETGLMAVPAYTQSIGFILLIHSAILLATAAIILIVLRVMGNTIANFKAQEVSLQERNVKYEMELYQRHLTENELRKSEYRYRTLFEHAQDAILLIDPDTNMIVDCNQQATDMLGFPPEKLIGADITTFYATNLDNIEPLTPVYQDLTRRRAIENIRFFRTGTNEMVIVEAHDTLLAVDDLTLKMSILRNATVRVQAQYKLAQALNRTEVLYTFAKTLIGYQSVPELLKDTAEHVADILQASQTVVIKLDMEKREIEHQIRGGPWRHTGKPFTFDELMDGLSGWAIRELKPAFSPYEDTDPREKAHVRERRDASPCGTVMVVPLHAQGKILGTMTAACRHDEHHFTEDDLDLMLTIANQLSVVMTNVELVKELRETNAALDEERNLLTQRVAERTASLQRHFSRQTALASIQPTISEPNALNELLQQISAVAATTIPADAGVAIFLEQGRQRQLELASFSKNMQTGLVIDLRRDFPDGLGKIAGPHVNSVRATVLDASSDIPETCRIWMANRHIQTAVIVPLTTRSGPIGLMLVCFNEKVSLSPEDLAFMHALAHRATVAVENVNLYRQLEQANKKLAASAEMKDAFLANMSHELRTPLSAILGRTESLQAGVYGPLTPRQQRQMTDMEASGNHLLALINEVLDVAKMSAGKVTLELEPVDIREICEQSLILVKPSAEVKTILLETSYLPEPVTLNGDPRRLRQILVNLLNNAIKFTPSGKKVGLRVDTTADRSNLVLEVWDQGIGIADDKLGHIFEPFTQLDNSLTRKYEGTGLGLVVVDQLVELHGGHIEVHSEVGEGSAFRVILPWRTTASEEPSEPSAENGTPVLSATTDAPDRPFTILVADDNSQNSSTLLDYLRFQGYQTISAENGEDAVQMALSEQPDLVLMDIQMPVMDGLEATRRLRSAEFANPIITLTGLAMPGDEERCRQAGASDYLSKPVSLLTLSERIARLLPQKKPNPTQA